MKDVIHIADADAIIAMISKRDASHGNAKAIIQKVSQRGDKILFPATAITEAITTCQIRLNSPQLAKELAQQIAANSLPVIPIDGEILELAAGVFNSEGSRKNTFFDATIAATAKKYGTNTIFSFDSWYRKLGFTLLVDTL